MTDENHYQVLDDFNLNVLENEVSELIRLGWIPIGGAFYRNDCWHQTLWRPYPEKKR